MSRGLVTHRRSRADRRGCSRFATLSCAVGAGPFQAIPRRESPDVSVDVSTEVIIARPQAEVSTFAADPDNAPAWYENITSVEWKSAPPLQIGSKVAFVAKFMRKRLAYTYEIAELVPHQRLVMRTAEGPFPMETTYTWSTVNGTETRMSLRNRGTPRGFSRFVAPFLAAGIRRANRKDLARLKTLLERK